MTLPLNAFGASPPPKPTKKAIINRRNLIARADGGVKYLRIMKKEIISYHLVVWTKSAQTKSSPATWTSYRSKDAKLIDFASILTATQFTDTARHNPSCASCKARRPPAAKWRPRWRWARPKCSSTPRVAAPTWIWRATRRELVFSSR